MREVVKPGSLGANRYIMFEDLPLSTDGWDVDIYHLEKTQQPTAMAPGGSLTVTAEQVQAVVEANAVASSPPVVVVEDGPLRAAVQCAVKISDQSWLQTTVLLEQGSDQLKFDCEAEWQEKHQFLKAEFPFDLLPHNGVASPGRHCHSTLSLSVIDCHSLGIHQYVVILLSWLSFLSK